MNHGGRLGGRRTSRRGLAAPVAVLLAAAAWASAPVAAPAQVVAHEQGTVGAGLRLRQLDGVKRVLMIGAHPDDEDTSLLAALARGRGVETAYLSLTRGEGGQNLIGPELGEGLGIVRTGELLAARELDGGRQFFTRAFDYGYSKNAEEAFTMWPREELLADVVKVVRRFRPHVIVSIFTGTPADGHGQHQAAGILAQEAFEAAGDPSRFPEQLRQGLEPWEPLQLYRRFRRTRGDVVVEVPTGEFDPLLGRSHFQLAMASRSQHRSQDMGVSQHPGPRASTLVLMESRVPPGDPPLPFAGVDTALASLVSGTPEVVRQVSEYRAALREAEEALDALRPWQAAPPLARALSSLRAAASAPGVGADAAAVLETRLVEAGDALLDLASVVVEVRVADDLVVPGEDVEVDVQVWNGGPFPVEGVAPELVLPGAWSATLAPGEGDGEGGGFFGGRGGTPMAGPGPVEPGELGRWTWRVQVPEDAEVSRLYYLQLPRDGAMYRWPEETELHGLPRDADLLEARVPLTLALSAEDGGPVRLEPRRSGRYVGVDKASGEFRRPVLVVPALSVGPEARVLAWPISTTEPRDVTVFVRNYGAREREGVVRLEVPSGWSAEPEEIPFRFTAPEEGRTFTFRVRPDGLPEAGTVVFRGVAETAAGRRYAEGVELVDYPHIPRAALFHDSEARVAVFPVRVAEGLRVGYVMGSGDDGLEALRQLGVDVEALGPEAVRSGDFGRFDAVVLGVRAYETRPDLAAANDQLLEFARRGGTVLVQYNKYEFPEGDYAPYPVDMSRPHDRVTDENAPVTILRPSSPVFTTPNRITEADFEGWIQERGLYFLGEWDERYTPLLEMADPGEEPKRGALVVAPVGEGLWIYTGLAFFRQFPEGVPGAFRVFANLVSLDAGTWSAAADGPAVPEGQGAR